MKKLIIILASILAVSCGEIYENPETHYLIEKGEHNSKVVGGFIGDKMRTLKSSNYSFTARFDETARYDLGNKNQFDINKLMGFSDANSLHQENSIRFGWCYNLETDKIDIFGYAYLNGDRFFKRITDVGIGETINYQIFLTEATYELTVNGDAQLSIPRSVQNQKGVYYMLFPYFGGDERAPHRINIFIKERF